MTAENKPLSRTEPCKKRFALARAQFGVGINRRHKYRRVVIILRLARNHIFHIYKNVTAENNVIFVVNQHIFARQMSASALKNLKMQVTEIKLSGISGSVPDAFSPITLIFSGFTDSYDVKILQICIYGL